MNPLKINAAQARAMFPKVVGEIAGAELRGGFAILDMGPKAFGVMVAGEMVACCPNRRAAIKAGERAADAIVAAARAEGRLPA